MAQTWRDFRDALGRIEKHLSQIEARLRFSSLVEYQQMTAMDDAVTKLTADVTAERAVVDSVNLFVTGVPKLVRDAVDAALAAGASAAQLAAVMDAAAALEKQSADIAAAILTGTIPVTVVTQAGASTTAEGTTTPSGITVTTT
jgi:hypothetical protein